MSKVIELCAGVVYLVVIILGVALLLEFFDVLVK